MSGSSRWMKEVLSHASRIENSQDRDCYLIEVCGDKPNQLQQLRTWFETQENEVSPLDRAISYLHDITPQLDRITTTAGSLQSLLHNSESLEPVAPEEFVTARLSEPPKLVDLNQRSSHDENDEFSPEHLCNSCIGPYKLLRVLGRGGMGVVYEAKQYTPINRNVAIKLIDIEFTGTFSRIHFEAERKALELMNHPGITGLLDAGVTSWGAPYYVMELVRGVPIHTYCENNKLPLESTLKLFISLCSAVQHAHHKGIVHRDLKPSNVLVTEFDDEPVVKLIDFGIALNKEILAHNSPAEFPLSFHAGTPMYMSPEQASGNIAATDTRSDVYSLGVILFNLLTHSTPIDREAFDAKSNREIKRILLETPPARPSDKLENPKSAYAKKIRYELDWIVGKAISKHPAQRYATPLALADDIGNFLNGKVVQAKPPSWQYLSSKWLTSNMAIIIPAMVCFLVLTVGTIVSLTNLHEARKAQEASKRLLINADMKLASEAFIDGNFRLARERLERHQGNLSDEFENSFAWRYLWKRVHPELFSNSTDAKIFDIAHHPTQDEYVTSHDGGELLVWHSNNNTPSQSLKIDDQTIRSARYSPNGKYLVTGNVQGNVKLWQTGESSLIASLTIVQGEDVYSAEWIGNSAIAVTTGESVTILDVERILSTHQSLPPEPTSSRPFPKLKVALHTPDGIDYRELDCIRQRLGPFHGSAYGIAISPDERQIAVTTQRSLPSIEGMVTVWDIGTWKQVCRIFSKTKSTAVAYHPNANLISLPEILPAQDAKQHPPIRNYLIATGTQNGIVQTNLIQEQQGTYTNHLIATNTLHTSNIYKLGFSDDGRYLVSVSKDATARVWETASLNCLQTIQSHLSRVYSLCFKPNSHVFLSVGWDAKVRASDASELGIQKSEFPTTPHATSSKSSKPEDNRLFANITSAPYDKDTLFMTGTLAHTGLFNTTTGDFDQIPIWSASSISIAKNGYAAIGRSQGSISQLTESGLKRFDVDSTEPVDIDMDGVPDSLTGFGKEGYQVFLPSAGEDRTPRLVPCNSPFQCYEIQVTPVANDGTFELVSVAAGATATLVKCNSEKIVSLYIYETYLENNSRWSYKHLEQSGKTAQVFAAPRSTVVTYYPNFPADHTRIMFHSESMGVISIGLIDLDQDGQLDRFAFLDDSNSLDIYELLPEHKLKLLQRIPVPPEMHCLDVVQDDESLAIYVASNQGIYYTRWDGQKFQNNVSQVKSLDDLSWQRPVSANLILYDAHQKRLLKSFHQPLSGTLSFTLSPDGKQLALASYGTQLRYGEALSSQNRYFTTNRDSKSGIAFTPDNQRLCFVVGDQVWFTNPSSGQIINVGKSHSNSVTKLTVSHSGKFVATGSKDLCVYLWDPTSGMPIRSFVGHKFAITNIAFSEDERWLATSDLSGVIKLWDIQTGGELMELQDPNGEPSGLSFQHNENGEIKLITISSKWNKTGLIQVSEWATSRKATPPKSLPPKDLPAAAKKP